MPATDRLLAQGFYPRQLLIHSHAPRIPRNACAGRCRLVSAEAAVGWVAYIGSGAKSGKSQARNPAISKDAFIDKQRGKYKNVRGPLDDDSNENPFRCILSLCTRRAIHSGGVQRKFECAG